jgi:hypothetical protein
VRGHPAKGWPEARFPARDRGRWSPLGESRCLAFARRDPLVWKFPHRGVPDAGLPGRSADPVRQAASASPAGARRFVLPRRVRPEQAGCGCRHAVPPANWRCARPGCLPLPGRTRRRNRRRQAAGGGPVARSPGLACAPAPPPAAGRRGLVRRAARWERSPSHWPTRTAARSPGRPSAPPVARNWPGPARTGSGDGPAKTARHL